MVHNYPSGGFAFDVVLNMLRCYEIPFDYNKNRDLISYITKNPESFEQTIKKDIVLDSALQKLERLSKLKIQDDLGQYDKLYQDVIGVGEFSIEQEKN